MQKFNYIPILIVFIIGCREPEESYEENLCVYSYLCPNLDYQTVYVDKVYKMEEVVPKDTLAISGANCIIYKFGGDTITLIEKKPGIYTTPPYWRLTPKTTYGIEVKYQNYLIKGKTTVPDTFSIISLSNNDTVNVPSDKKLIWSFSEGAKMYLIWVLVYGDTTQKILFEPDNTTKLITPSVAFDTVLPIFSDTTKFDTSGLWTIKVLALDENAYERSRRMSPGDIDTLEGGLGFIGSIAFDTVTVYIKK